MSLLSIGACFLCAAIATCEANSLSSRIQVHEGHEGPATAAYTSINSGDPIKITIVDCSSDPARNTITSPDYQASNQRGEPQTLEKLAAGRSGVVYKIDTDWVLKLGNSPGNTEELEQEFRGLEALGKLGIDVPTTYLCNVRHDNGFKQPGLIKAYLKGADLSTMMVWFHTENQQILRGGEISPGGLAGGRLPSALAWLKPPSAAGGRSLLGNKRGKEEDRDSHNARGGNPAPCELFDKDGHPITLTDGERYKLRDLFGVVTEQRVTDIADNLREQLTKMYKILSADFLKVSRASFEGQVQVFLDLKPDNLRYAMALGSDTFNLYITDVYYYTPAANSAAANSALTSMQHNLFGTDQELPYELMVQGKCDSSPLWPAFKPGPIFKAVEAEVSNDCGTIHSSPSSPLTESECMGGLVKQLQDEDRLSTKNKISFESGSSEQAYNLIQKLPASADLNRLVEEAQVAPLQ